MGWSAGAGGIGGGFAATAGGFLGGGGGDVGAPGFGGAAFPEPAAVELPEGVWRMQDMVEVDGDVTASCCDVVEERVWAGTSDGRLVGYAYVDSPDGGSSEHMSMTCSAVVSESAVLQLMSIPQYVSP